MSIIKIFANSNYISVNRDMIKLFGIHEALLLGELCSEYSYYESMDQLTENEWFYSTSENITERIGLSKFQQLEALKTLIKNNIIEQKLAGMPAKRYFKINIEIVLKLLDNKLSKNLTTSCQKTKQQVVKKLDININNTTLINNINNKEKIYKKEISISKKEELQEVKEKDFQEVYKTFCEKEELQERTVRSKEYQDTFKKYQNALKKYSHEEILKGIQDYIIFLECQKKTGFNRDKQGIIPFFNQEKFLGEKGSSWQELINKISKDIQEEVVNKLKFTRLKQEMRSQVKQKEHNNLVNKLIENLDF